MSIMAIRKCIEKTPFLNLIGEFSSGLDAMKAVKHLNIDIIFLDIEMPEMNGIELIRNLRRIPQIIINSSSTDYAAEAFDYNVTDYIVKPVDYDRFLKAVEKAQTMNESIQVTNSGKDVFFIKKDTRLVKINANEIKFVEAKADYVSIYLEDRRHTILSTMKAIESKLNPSEFVRIHRSYIVQLNCIDEIDNNMVTVGEKILPISRSYKLNLMEKLNLL